MGSPHLKLPANTYMGSPRGLGQHFLRQEPDAARTGQRGPIFYPIQRTRKRRSKCPFMAKVLSCSI